jgi:hypothetical protein
MKKCQFLERRCGQKSGRRCYCGAGVNFYLVGEKRYHCRACPLNDLGNAPLCEYLEVYTFLERDVDGEQRVKVRFHCDLLEETLDSLSVCGNCRHCQVARPSAPSTLALQPGAC